MDTSAIHERLNSDLAFFAEYGPLYIKGKTAGLAQDEDGDGPGALIKWKMNTPQKWMQFKAEEQRKEKGWVRMLLVKGRQQGGSTWAGARFYHAARSIPGTSVAIISHEGKSTTKLFKMVERFNDNVNAALRPEVGKSNANQLTFPGIHSDYTVYTAGSEDAGRSGTAQKIHGSEVAYWPNDYAIQDSALESVALMAGTEIILESTGDGPKGLFYDKCMMALRKIGDYQLVFIPWYWQPEYERDVPVDFVLDPEEQEYAAAHFPEGLKFPFEQHELPPMQVLRKMAWRRAKILDLSTANGGVNVAVGHAKFKRIYPSFPIEPFQFAGLGVIRADAIQSARKNFNLVDDDASMVIGVDPAGDSDSSDRTVIALRRGRVISEVIVYERMKPMRLAGIVDLLIKKHNAQMVFVDNGHGEGTVDRLHEMGHRRRVQGVWFNEGSLFPEKYRNKRSEIILEAAKWINDGGVRIPDDNDVHADLAAMPLPEETSEGIKYMKSKREIKKMLGRSPDIYDAIALTFAYPVISNSGSEGNGNWRKAAPGGVRTSGGLSSLARKRALGGT